MRCNHIYDGSKEEIDAIIKNGADIVMLPYFKTVKEVKQFLDYVGGRAKTCLLVETPEAGMLIDVGTSGHRYGSYWTERYASGSWNEVYV